MTVLDTQDAAAGRARPEPHAVKVGPIGRLGHYTATHFRVVLIAWLVIAVVLGFFAPRVETALSGAGWETTGSQSVQARQLIDKNFKGLSSYGLMTVALLADPDGEQPGVPGCGHERRADAARRPRGQHRDRARRGRVHLP